MSRKDVSKSLIRKGPTSGYSLDLTNDFVWVWTIGVPAVSTWNGQRKVCL